MKRERVSRVKYEGLVVKRIIVDIRKRLRTNYKDSEERLRGKAKLKMKKRKLYKEENDMRATEKDGE